MLDWPAVGNTRIASGTGQLDQALAVARSIKPGPVRAGTVVQLMPSEAMMKLALGTAPATDDWQYLELKRGKPVIAEQGGEDRRDAADGCHDGHTTAPQ